MKKLLKKSVPAFLALLLFLIPAGMLTAEASPAERTPALPPAIAHLAEEEETSSEEADASKETAPEDSSSEGADASKETAPEGSSSEGAQPAQSDSAGSAATAAQSQEQTAAAADAHYNHIWPAPAESETKSVLVLESSTSTVLYEKEADTTRYPASTTKILTGLVAIENSSPDEIITFSENAVNLEEAATNIRSQAGEQMTMRDALYGLLLPSGNDCAVAIAEHIAGSVSAFADMMNAKAEELGCTASHFSNPHGLFAEDHYTTARDLALIAQEAFNNSTFVEIVSTPVYHAAATNMYGERTFNNTNLLLDEDSDYYDPDAIGGKTGYLDEAGRCLVEFGKRGNISVITILLNGGYTQVFGETKMFLDFAFDHFTLQNVAANERRFSYAVEDAKVVLDPAAQILTLSAIPFDQLESELIFAEDLSVDRKAELKAASADADARPLFAMIDYSYAGHALGSVSIYLDPELELLPAAFTDVTYISPLYLVIFIIIVLILIISFYGTTKAAKRPAPAPVRRSAPQTYDDYDREMVRRREYEKARRRAYEEDRRRRRY